MSNAVIIDGGHFNIQSVTREVGPLPLPSSLAGSSSNRDVSVVVDAFTATLSNFQVNFFSMTLDMQSAANISFSNSILKTI